MISRGRYGAYAALPPPLPRFVEYGGKPPPLNTQALAALESGICRVFAAYHRYFTIHDTVTNVHIASSAASPGGVWGFGGLGGLHPIESRGWYHSRRPIRSGGSNVTCVWHPPGTQEQGPQQLGTVLVVSACIWEAGAVADSDKIRAETELRMTIPFRGIGVTFAALSYSTSPSSARGR